MAESNFVDYVKVCCRSGHGGAGSMHFHRDINTDKGGPDGGDGGRGGHIILRGNSQLWTLLHLKYRKHIIAEAGVNGQGALRRGARGKDEYIEVPIGTIAKDPETGKVLAEISEHGQEIILTPGGRGGLGNWHFKSSSNQTPTYSQPGETGLEEWRILELKLLADVGLVGFPNAGKSTLLSVVSAAKPKIADYAFTTLVPNLGIIPYRDYQSFVMADIPGIIEGAHLGKGLGHRFLRHIERNSILLFLIPADANSIIEEYGVLLNELKLYNSELLHKRIILAITKSDMLDDELTEAISKELPEGVPYIFISSLTNYNIDSLKDLLWKELHATE